MAHMLADLMSQVRSSLASRMKEVESVVEGMIGIVKTRWVHDIHQRHDQRQKFSYDIILLHLEIANPLF